MLRKNYLLIVLLFLTSCSFNFGSKSTIGQVPLPSTDNQTQSLLDDDKVEIFLKQINQETGLGFSDPGPLDFGWKIAGDKLGKIRNLETTTVSGQATALFAAPRMEKNSNTPILTIISNYLNSKGFIKDIYNSNAGTVTGTEAYQNGAMKCLVNWEIIGGIEGYKTTDVPMNLALICGEIDK